MQDQAFFRAINLVIPVTCISFLVGWVTQQEPQPQSAVAQSSSLRVVAPTAPGANKPRLFKMNITLSKPEDLKVRPGDTVAAGDVLADQDKARNRLMQSKRELTLSLQKIQSQSVLTPPKPSNVPSVRGLPPVSFAEEKAAIASAQQKIEEQTHALDLHKQSLQIQPPQETAALEKMRTKTAAARVKLDIQQRKIDAIASMEGLPEAVSEHEVAVMQQLQTEADTAEASERMAVADLEAASLKSAENERRLNESLRGAMADLNLVKSRLQAATDRRHYQEYEYSVTASRRAEEQNQVQQAYSQQLLEAQSQQRDKDYQLAQITSQIQAIDNQLATLSTIKAPYSGTIRRIKYEGQTDQNIKVELTLVVDGGDSDSFTRPSVSPRGG